MALLFCDGFEEYATTSGQSSRTEHLVLYRNQKCFRQINRRLPSQSRWSRCDQRLQDQYGVPGGLPVGYAAPGEGKRERQISL